MQKLNDAKEKLYALQKKLAAYDHALGLITYDGVTTAPKETAENRAVSLSVLSEELYIKSTSPETVELLEYL
ncbi:MAG: carboxypeptidase M32, partial [Eubacterium sp.]|nr:carboxypeptidase M32 [Eubacterium sp.]